ncbi:TonB-dependent receptor domain-containing protein [Aquimarina sp. 2-A2]|uniref:TonB-dependent receptor domain-containing protein n=1 Tax=Aquimarina sp. 2-A2 TaxID=3382644 RepID=UPI00387EED34
MKKIMFFLLLGVSINMHSQSLNNLSITGTILDKSTQEPLPFATIILLQSNTIVTGASTDQDGTFDLTTKRGNYTIQLEFMGYETVILPKQSYQESINLGTLYLEETIEQLDAIAITAEKSTVEYKLDKKIFNVGEDLISKGGSVGDVLNNVPSVTVDAIGAISLRGNPNVRILINGKPSVLTANNGLDQIPADTIEKVEISTNPSSRYGAEGTAGIINIVLKRNKKGGFGSSIQATMGYPKNYGVNYNFNYKTKKFNIFSNLSHRNLRFPGSMTYFQTNLSDQGSASFIEQDVSLERNYKLNTVYVGGDYYINENNTLTFSYYLTNNISNQNVTYLYDFLTSDKELDKTIKATNTYEEPQNANQIEVNYVKTFQNPDKKLTANIQYDFWNDDENENISEQEIFPTEKAKQHIRSRDIESSKDLLVQSDYAMPVFKNSQLEMGVRGEIRRINSDYKVWTNNLLVDSLDNLLRYDEKIYGAYVQYGNKDNKFEYAIGLRVEHSNTKTKDRKNLFKNHKKYTDLFPTVHLTYNFSEKQSLQLSYSKRITRPRFWQLNPFGGIADRNNIRYGNPDLNPMYTHSFELALLQRWNRFTMNPSVYYQRSTNIFEMITFATSDNVISTLPVNLGIENRYGFELVSTYSPFQWWRLSGEINLYGFDQTGTFENKDYNTRDSAWTSRINSSLKFTKFSVQTTFNYTGARTSGQTYTRDVAWLNLSLSKDFLSDRMSLTVNAYNLFNSRITKQSITGEDYSLDIVQNTAQRRLSATLTYRFNRTKKDKDRLPD